MTSPRLRIHEVESVKPIDGWWREQSNEDQDTKEKTLEYRKIIGIATLLIDNIKGAGRTRVSVPVTAAQLTQYNYDAIYGEGGFFVWDVNMRLYHDYDFEIIGQELKEGAESSTSE